MVRLLIHSDLACPFCYLAESTLANLATRWEFSLEWLAFELHPEIPEGGFSLADAASPQAGRLYDMALWPAATLKIPMNPPGTIPNSRCGMAAITALATHDRDASRGLRRALFDACYVKGLPVSTQAEVLEIGRPLLSGVHLEVIRTATTGQRPAQLIQESKQAGFEALVSGVPVIRFFRDGTERKDLRVMGAQPEETFERIFEAIEVSRV